MDERYAHITAVASKQFGAISVDEMDRLGVDRRVRSEWASRGLIERAGPRSYVIVGSADSWQRTLWTASADVEGFGFVAGRSGARLFGLDGFHSDAIELLVGRRHRGMRSTHRVCSTELELSRIDSVVVDGIRCLTPERLILDSPLFGFDRSEIENAIDSAIRMRLVSEQRLRTGVISRHRSGINGGRALLDALVDTGGESRLERWFLTLVRAGGLARPVIQQVWRDGQRTVARLDALFPAGSWSRSRATARTPPGKIANAMNNAGQNSFSAACESSPSHTTTCATGRNGCWPVCAMPSDSPRDNAVITSRALADM